MNPYRGGGSKGYWQASKPVEAKQKCQKNLQSPSMRVLSIHPALLDVPFDARNSRRNNMLRRHLAKLTNMSWFLLASIRPQTI